MSELKKNMRNLRERYESIRPPAELKERLDSMMKQETKKRAPILWLQRVGGGVAAAALMLTVATNASAQAAETLGRIPVIGAFTRVVTFRDYSDQRENTEAKIETPHVTGIGDRALEDAINAEFDAYADELIAGYEADVALLGEEGHESVTSSYEVTADNGRYLTVAIATVVARGGAQQINRYYTVDKAGGRLVTLADLFLEGADYVTPISENIRAQMREQMAGDEGRAYFLQSEGEPEGFAEIRADQQFYLSPEGRLVISFDEYEVAPGYMGAVAFEIPAGVTAEIANPAGLLGAAGP